VTTSPPTLSIIVPTIGRASLVATIQSFDYQLGPLDEVIVISDGPNRKVRELVAAVGSRYVYLETAERMWDYGGTPRNIGISMARGKYIGFMDDDDTSLPGALDAIRQGAMELPGIPLIFRMRHQEKILWETPEIKAGNVSSQMFAVPNIPGKLGHWTARYAGDFDFIVHTIELHGGAVAFREEVIAELLQAAEGRS
jgi:glycosyltransferase involved in cell wall biosynthesis